MPLLRVAIQGLSDGEHALDPAAAHYLLRVHRLRVGASFFAFDPLAATECEATLLGERPPRARFETPRAAALRPARSVTLLQALGKGDKPERVVDAATAMGVTALCFVASERSVKKVDAERAEQQRERWQRVAIDAARQSGRGDVPELRGPRSSGTSPRPDCRSVSPWPSRSSAPSDDCCSCPGPNVASWSLQRAPRPSRSSSARRVASPTRRSPLPARRASLRCRSGMRCCGRSSPASARSARSSL
jgi:hypothetical protein